MGFTFKKATKHNARLRAALVGPSGGGKTYTALAIATSLGRRVAVIDTERGSASKYAGLFEFDVLELESFAPATYVDAMNAAAREGYDVVVIDSLSHAWMGRDGALEMVDRAAAKSRSGNSFDAWRTVTPHHHALVDAMLRLDAHLLVTMRVKTEYLIEEDSRGKKVPRKVGLAPVQRDGLEYEFDVVADIDLDHRLVVSKTRCPELADKVFDRAGADVARILSGWLTGTPRAEAPPAEPVAETPAQLAAFLDAVAEIELPGEAVAVWMKHRADLAPLSAIDREAAWKALCARTEEVGKMKNARVWLKKAIAEEDARRGAEAATAEHQVDDGAPDDDVPPWEQLATQAARTGTLAGLADLWAGSTEERRAMPKSDRETLWARFVDRACAIEGAVDPSDAAARKAVNAALLKLVTERKPPPGPGGSPTRAGEGSPAHADGGAVDGGAAAGPVALGAVPAWDTGDVAAEERIARYGDRIAIERACRKYRTGLRSNVRALLATRLQKLSWEPECGTITQESARELVDRWIAQGKRPTRPPVPWSQVQRTAGGAR